MIELKAWRYDGKSSARTAVVLRFTQEALTVCVNNDTHRYIYSEVTPQPRIAGIPLHLDFADGSQCEIENQPMLKQALDMLPGSGTQRFIHKIENHWPSIIIVLLLAIAVLFGIVQYGIPVMAHQVANAIPVEVEIQMGSEAMTLFDRFLEPSKLDASRQNALREKFLSLAKQAGIQPREIVFRGGKDIGANAFALPSGIIVFTDEMVKLAQDDHELLGVFAHELGHVKYRHTLQQVLQNTTAGLLLIVLTGDISSTSSLAAALPTVLLQTRFSRAAERESDDYAITLLRQQNISPEHLGNILKRLEQQTGGDDVPGFLSTHPATDERVRRFNGKTGF